MLASVAPPPPALCLRPSLSLVLLKVPAGSLPAPSLQGTESRGSGGSLRGLKTGWEG